MRIEVKKLIFNPTGENKKCVELDRDLAEKSKWKYLELDPDLVEKSWKILRDKVKIEFQTLIGWK